MLWRRELAGRSGNNWLFGHTTATVAQRGVPFFVPMPRDGRGGKQRGISLIRKTVWVGLLIAVIAAAGTVPVAKAHGDKGCSNTVNTPWKDGSLIKGTAKFQCDKPHATLEIKVELQYWSYAEGRWKPAGDGAVTKKAYRTSSVRATDTSSCARKMRLKVYGNAWDRHDDWAHSDTDASKAVYYC